MATIRILAALLLLGASASALDPQAPLQHFGVRSWLSESGLPQDTVHAILQTSDGFIWVGTERGLARFDGVSFTTFDKRSGLPGSFIQSLFEDRSHALWICTAEGLARHTAAGFDVFTTTQGLPSNDVSGIFQDSSGTLWGLSASGLARFNGSTFEKVPGLDDAVTAIASSAGHTLVGAASGLYVLTGDSLVRESSVPAPVRAIVSAPDHHVWIATRDGLFSYDGHRYRAYTVADGLPDNDARALQVLPSGAVWIATTKGAAVLESSSIHSFTARNGLPSDNVISIFADSHSTVWLGTARGISRVVNGNVSALPSRDSFSAVALSFFEDREGSLWIGTEGSGLEFLHDQKFTTLTASDGLPQAAVAALARTSDDRLWIGTNGSGLAAFNGKQWQQYTTAAGLPSDSILSLAPGIHDDLWLGTPDGLVHLTGDSFRTYTTADGLADDFVRSILVEPNGKLWLGTRRGLSQFVNGTFTNLSTLDGLPSDLVGALVPDGNGGVWIGTRNGLSHLAGGQFHDFARENGLASPVITALHMDSAGALWIGSSGGSLSRLSNGTIVAAPSSLDLPDSIYAILERDGYLWLSSPQGIFRASLQQLNAAFTGPFAHVDLQRFGVNDGVLGTVPPMVGHPAAIAVDDGHLWFATSKGIARIDSATAAWNKLPPPVAIEQVLVNGQQVPFTDRLSLKPGESNVTINYAALTFIAPSQVHYKYQLKGFDPQFVDAGNRRTAYYTNVPAGDYTFRVIAANSDGTWNDEGASLSVNLAPHIYQTRWFYALVLLAMGAIIYLIYLARMRSAQGEFAAVLDERNRIAREIHDTLAQSLVGISVNLEVLSNLLGTAPAAAHEQLQRTSALVREGIAEARRSIWNLRADHKARPSFSDSLTSAAAGSATLHGPKLNVNISGPVRPLDPQREAELLRIAQEAVSNAVRHANASAVDVLLLYMTDAVRLTVKDDGNGFDVAQTLASPNGHYGLIGLQERAARIGGELSIISNQSGTTVTLHAPASSRQSGARA